MLKKLLIPTLIITAGILLGLKSAPPANAEKISIDGIDYWTLDEVAEKGQKYSEDLKMCEKNRECEEYLDLAYTLAGNEYSAGQGFMTHYFIISAINPAEATIRVIFHDEANRGMMMPGDNDEKDVMRNLHIYWWDGAPERWIFAFDNPVDEKNRQDIFTHISESEEEWLAPNKEIELKIPDFDFSHLKTSRIFFYAESKKGNAVGDRDATACMNAIDNLNGYECQAVFDRFGNIEYQPVKAKEKSSTESIEAPDKPKANHDEENPTTEVISTSTMRVLETTTEVAKVTTPEVATEGQAGAILEVATEGTTGTITEVAETPKDTVEVPLVAGKKEDHEFPWWLVVFIFSGIFLILWWFVPIRRKKDEKNS